MQIKFKQKHDSITDFLDVDIPDFSVFLGMNGSGKTHLLEAIEKGFVTVDNIPTGDIAYFDFKTFLVKNQRSVTPRNHR